MLVHPNYFLLSCGPNKLCFVAFENPLLEEPQFSKLIEPMECVSIHEITTCYYITLYF